MKRAALTLLLILARLLAPVPEALASGHARVRASTPVSACDPAALKAPEPSPEARRDLEAKLAEARAVYKKNPNDADALIWLGRRTAYLGRFAEAIKIFTEGIEKYPRDARMYRHRGHRYITVRCFDRGVEDLERAAKLVKGRPDEIEPDGLPNARNTPTSTTNSNIYYHLGLAHYLKGDFRKALTAYRECMKFSKNPDMLVATSHWLYMTLRRLNRQKEADKVLAAIDEEMDIIENRDYHRLLMMYKGKITPESLLLEASKNESSLGFASIAYGLGNWYLYTGEQGTAAGLFTRIVEGPQVTSFGYIAAEAELRRSGVGIPHPQTSRRTIFE